ncbi:hypothetical protein [Xenorhabdus innexi]|uniref:Uncharacterized protein n=1 Tax=Xenorhabdus innexi TaxID=290109 RepID=A0A1N6N0K0_9GAMM|nr:hypothetical protein [Xenorhabdus innexi]SIP74626.1 hypothetical protein XIS1_690010 [Xenorhabdus innexi]
MLNGFCSCYLTVVQDSGRLSKVAQNAGEYFSERGKADIARIAW